MKLKEAYELLHKHGNDHHRAFAAIFKHYKYTEEAELKDYLDFVECETLEWFKGFPGGMVTKEALNKPKTALVKLLKLEEVKTALGADYVAKVHRKVWDTFKQNVDAIHTERMVRIARESPDISDIQSPWNTEIPAVPLGAEDIDTPVDLTEPIRIQREPIPKKDEPRTDAERVRILKDVLYKMGQTLPAGASDAFRLLVSLV